VVAAERRLVATVRCSRYPSVVVSLRPLGARGGGRRSLLQYLAHALRTARGQVRAPWWHLDDHRGGCRLSSLRVSEGPLLAAVAGLSGSWFGPLRREHLSGSAFGCPGTFRVPGSPRSRVASVTGSRARAASEFALGTAQLATASLGVGVTGSASSASHGLSAASAVGGSTPGVLAGIGRGRSLRRAGTVGPSSSNLFCW
jgi:hypothetical protein